MPGPVPRRGVTQATVGPGAPCVGEAAGVTDNSDWLQKNCDVFSNKATDRAAVEFRRCLQEENPPGRKVHKEDSDTACIQESHLTDNLRLMMRGYQSS